jgi:hypothetical protein
VNATAFGQCPVPTPRWRAASQRASTYRRGLGNQNDVASHLKRHVRLSGVQLMVLHVIIVGGGFGGLSAARALRGAAVRVTLVDKRNYHLFRPMLYQVRRDCFRTMICKQALRYGRTMQSAWRQIARTTFPPRKALTQSFARCACPIVAECEHSGTISSREHATTTPQLFCLLMMLLHLAQSQFRRARFRTGHADFRTTSGNASTLARSAGGNHFETVRKPCGM